MLALDTPHRVQHAVEEIFTRIRTSFPVCELLLDGLVSLLQLAGKGTSGGATGKVAGKMVFVGPEVEPVVSGKNTTHNVSRAPIEASRPTPPPIRTPTKRRGMYKPDGKQATQSDKEAARVVYMARQSNGVSQPCAPTKVFVPSARDLPW